LSGLLQGTGESADYGRSRTYEFRHCWVHVSPGYTETVYHDGSRVCAAPELNETYFAKAERYGYGRDVAALSREHEILHTFLAEKLGYGSSPTLWAVAHNHEGGVAPVWEMEEEETMVLAFQVYLNGGPAGEGVRRLTDAGLDLESLRVEALALLRE